MLGGVGRVIFIVIGFLGEFGRALCARCCYIFGILSSLARFSFFKRFYSLV